MFVCMSLISLKTGLFQDQIIFCLDFHSHRDIYAIFRNIYSPKAFMNFSLIMSSLLLNFLLCRYDHVQTYPSPIFEEQTSLLSC